MFFYAVVSAETEKVVELFARADDADAMVAAVRRDDQCLAARLRVEAIEVADPSPN